MHEHPWIIIVTAALAYDAWLIRSGRLSLTCHARQQPIVLAVGTGYLLAHLYGVLPRRGDAFDLALTRLRKEPATS